MTSPSGRYRDVRWRADVGFEMRCDSCAGQHNGGAIYWPLTGEFWNASAGLSRCRACWLVYWRRRVSAARAANPELLRARDRARYRRNRRVIAIKRQVYYQENRETILARRRARYAARAA